MRALRFSRVAAALLLTLCAAACSYAPPPRVAPTAETYAAATIPGVERPRFWGDETSPEQREKSRAIYENAVTRKWRAQGAPASGVTLDFLALSGGGPDGAFAAGLLAGWSRQGDRPAFDLVTGISVGALIAPFVFLGPEYDDALREVFTELGADAVAVLQPFKALFGAPGLADTTPLRRTLERLVDAHLLRRVAEVDGEGRSLLIGTTHIDSGRPVIWDMGAIARAGRVKLFRDVMIASASIPGAFPPVAIDVVADGKRFSELHVDGGVTHSVFVWPAGYEAVLRRDLPFPVRQTIYVIQNSPLAPAFKPVEPSLLAIATRSLSTLIRSQSAGDLAAIKAAADASGSAFKLVFVPPGFEATSTVAFDTAYMRSVYEAAYADALNGIDWMDQPPGLVILDEDATADD